MFKRQALFGLIVIASSLTMPLHADEAGDLLAKKSALQRQKDELLSLDRKVLQVTTSWQRISSDFQTESNRLSSNLQNLQKTAEVKAAEIENLSKWMSSKYPILKSTSNQLVFKNTMDEYRALRAGTACSRASIDEIFYAMINNLNTMRNLNNEAVELEKNWTLPQNFDQMRSAIKEGSAALSENFESAKKAAISVMPLAISSDACDAFLQFDVVISLTQTIAELNSTASSIDAIDVDKFLKDIDSLEKERNLIKHARRIATSMAGRNIANIRLGKLNETIQFASVYRAQTEILLTPIKTMSFAPNAERTEAIASINSSLEEMARELENSKVFAPEGKRAFLLTRSRDVHTRLFKLNSATLDATKAELYQIVKSYCETELKMTPSARYSVPANLDFEQSMKLDNKLAKAQVMLGKIDGVEI